MNQTPTNPAHKMNPLHLIHRWSIEHPQIIIAFYVAVVALAWMAVGNLIPRRFAPYVESPMIGVVTMMPGLSAQEMESQVSKPVEEQMNSVKGVRAVRSTSQDGASIVTLEFPYGTDMQRALVDVQALMNVTQGSLPNTGANMKPSFIVPIDPLNLPVVSLSLRGDPDKGWDMVRVREFADNEAVRRLKSVPNVYAVVPFGGFRRQMQVIVDRDRLAAYRLSILDVRDAIDRYNVAKSGGTVTGGRDEAIVRVDNTAGSAGDILDYPISTSMPGTRSEPASVSGGDPMGGGGNTAGSMGGTSSPSPDGTNVNGNAT
ncbi:MAG: efflux RND transporter permease subunit, partial [Fibrella sp.]|nr:efflux RND transporter permease subunit [Armatimonadota bacterium]